MLVLFSQGELTLRFFADNISVVAITCINALSKSEM